MKIEDSHEDIFENDGFYDNENLYMMPIVNLSIPKTNGNGECIDVSITHDYYDNGMLHYFICKDKDGNMHMDNDVPAYVEFGTNGLPLNIEYSIHGKFHRSDDRPSRIEYYPSGILSSVEYFNNGLLDRMNDMPAKILYNEDGSRDCETYHKEGIIHRDGTKPASITYKNNIIHKFGYYKNGKLLKEREIQDYFIKKQIDKRKDVLLKIHKKQKEKQKKRNIDK